MSATLIDREAFAANDQNTRSHAGILVASDATPGARGALTIAGLLAEETEREVRVLSVIDPFYVGVPEFGVLPPPGDLERARSGARAVAVRRELTALGAGEGWPVEVRVGLPAQSIAGAAGRSNDALVIIGLGHHRLADRLLGRETALQVARFATQPVLAVPASATKLPQTAIVAADFSEHSAHAASAALSLLPSLRWMYLVHVRPASYPAVEADGLVELKMFRDSLAPGEDVRLQSVVLTGDDPAESLLRFAGLARADLLVSGTHGRGFFARLVHGSVSTGIVRGAECAVLVVPPPRAPFEAHEPTDEIPMIREHLAWIETLADFTNRNAGRRCTLEVDDPSVGAQLQAANFTFLGADYDRHDARVELMLGDMSAPAPHLSRSIGQVKAVDVAESPDRRETLRVAHGVGQTLLTVF